MSKLITKNDLKAILDATIPTSVRDVEIKGESVVDNNGVATISLEGLGVHISTSAPTSADGDDGDIWIMYTS